MKRLILNMLLMLCGFVASAQGVPVIGPEELVPGEPGMCMTEMDGGEMVEIPVTVIGVLGASAPEREMVLVRLHGERIEHTGIIAGMSGSPVYVRDRLLGALAFGWAFAKDPIAGVTPFGRMEHLADAGVASASGSGDRPPLAELIEAHRESRVGDFLVDWLLPDAQTPATAANPMPLVVSGWQDGSEAGWLADAWHRLNWVSAPGGAAVGGEPEAELKPGSAVAAVLVDGDAILSAGGTVTEVRGEQVWAFGHPFLGGGSIGLPMARGQVITVLPSLYSSFKFIGVGSTLGTLHVDRVHGVWGTLGRSPDMLPVSVSVDGVEYTFRTIRDPVLLPFLTGYLTVGSAAARGRTFGEAAVAMRLELDYADGQQAAFTESFSGLNAVPEAAAFASAVVAYLEGSAFAKPKLDDIRLTMKTKEKPTRATIVEAVAGRPVVRPGEKLSVRFRLQTNRGAEVGHSMEIEVPEWVSEGRIDLVVADGASWNAYDMQMRPPRPASFADEVRLVNRLVPSTRVVAVLEGKDTGVTIPGGSYAAPPSIVVNLSTALGSNVKTWSYRVAQRVEQEMPMPVTGAARLPLTVRNEDGSRATGR